MFNRLKLLFQNFNLRPVYNRLGGRSFLVVIFFAITGFWLAWNLKLTHDYVALVTALSGFHVWRATREDNKNDIQK